MSEVKVAVDALKAAEEEFRNGKARMDEWARLAKELSLDSHNTHVWIKHVNDHMHRGLDILDRIIERLAAIEFQMNPKIDPK